MHFSLQSLNISPCLFFILLFHSLLSLSAASSYSPTRLNETPGRLIVLEVIEATLTADCTRRPSVTINGTTPGPTLRFTPGEEVWIRVINRLTDANTTMHFHGISQYGSPFADGTEKISQYAIAPDGGYYDYHFKLDHTGTFIYHLHTDFHVSTGYGPLIIEDPVPAPYQYDEEFTLIFGDYYHALDKEIIGNIMGAPFKWPGDPQSLLVNGNALAVCNSTSAVHGCTTGCHHHTIYIKPGKTYRIRVIGITVLSYLYFAIEGHPDYEIIEVDGGFTKKLKTGHIAINSGQRYSALMRTKTIEELRQPGNKLEYWGRMESRFRPTRTHGAFVIRYDLSDYDGFKTHLSMGTDRTGHSDVEIETSYSAQPILKEGNPASLSYSRTVPPALVDFQKLVPLPNEDGEIPTVRYEELDPPEKAPTSAEVTRRIIIKGQQVKLPDGRIKWVVNGEAYVETMPMIPYLVRAYTTKLYPNYTAAAENGGYDKELGAYPIKLNDVVELVFINVASVLGVGEAHPWHIHGQVPFLTAEGVGEFSDQALKAAEDPSPLRRDTQVIYAGRGASWTNTTVPMGTQTGWMVWRMRANTPGAFLVHCHTQLHVVMGMGTVLLIGMEDLPQISDSQLKELTTPELLNPPPHKKKKYQRFK